METFLINMKNNWILKTKDKEIKYSSFEKAVDAFRKIVQNFIKDNETVFGKNDATPFSLGVYFSGKYDSIITNEEIVAYERSNMLLSSFLWDERAKAERQALTSIQESLSYTGTDSFNSKIKIEIKKDENGILFNHFSDNNGDCSFLATNAFLFFPENEYFYKCKEKVIASSNPNELGKTVEIEVVLFPECISEDTNDDMEFFKNIIADIKYKEFVSISYLQRTYSIGFNKASKIFDMLISQGFIEPSACGKRGNKVIANSFSKPLICSMCGKELNIFDIQENFVFSHHFGYGSKFDYKKIDIRLCCECMDKVLDKVLPMFNNNPMEECD